MKAILRPIRAAWLRATCSCRRGRWGFLVSHHVAGEVAWPVPRFAVNQKG